MKVYSVINKITRESTTTGKLAIAAEAAGMPLRTFQDRLIKSNGYWENSEFIITKGYLLK